MRQAKITDSKAFEKYLQQCTIINIHCHHFEDKAYQDYDLNVLSINTYVNWCSEQELDCPKCIFMT